MAKRGSVTIFLVLVLSLLLSLVCTSIESVRMAAARTQILCGMDIGLYSLFGQYDKTAWKDYDIFLVDGACGTESLKMDRVYRSMESYMKPILKQNSQKLSMEQGGFTGYQLITDEDGEVFFHQIVQYMKDTLGSQGAQLLFGKMRYQQKATEEAQRKGIEMKSGSAIESYDSAMNLASQNSKALEEKKKVELAAQTGKPVTEIVVAKPPQRAKNPIATIKRIMKMGILELVLPAGKQVSDKKTDKKSLLSNRRLQKGVGMIKPVQTDNSYTSQLLYQAYLMQKLGTYAHPSSLGLAYQTEYILCGKRNDIDNLRSVAEQLLLIREGVNFVSLMSDPGKRAAVSSLALAVASGFLVPPAAGVIETALILCWSFAESILDLRELFAGGKVPLVKRAEQWQISLENLPHLLSNLDSFRKNDPSGLSYEEYQQVLLLAKSKAEKIKRGMDMVELSIRSTEGRENFRLDAGIVALEAAVDVKANKRKVFTVTKQYSYD